MNLKQLCEQISCHAPCRLPENDPIGFRIMCPEYSLRLEDIKSYPLPKKEQLFALCWVLRPNQHLYATMEPSAAPFSYQCSFLSGDRTQLHTHDYLELAYVIEGEFRQKILGKDIIFKQGEFCLIDKNCLHQDYLDASHASILFLGIANSMFDEIMTNHIATDRIVSFLDSALLKQKNLQQYLHFKPHINAPASMEESLLSLLLELIRHDEASAYICRGLLIRIFRLLSTKYDFSLSKELRKEMNWLLFEDITDYINSHYTDITISTLMEHFHFQEDYFNRLIKSKTGMTYTEYVQSLRLKEAKRLLLDTNKSIEEITELIGYHNKGYFYKIFTKYNQITPAQYRKKHKEH